MSLFRSEALAAAGDVAGEAVRWRPRYGGIVLAALLGLLVLCGWWLAGAEYVRRLQVSGVVDLSSSRVPVRVELPGRLHGLRVGSGARVKAGEVLADLLHPGWSGSADAVRMAGLERLQAAAEQGLRLTEALSRHDARALEQDVEDLERRLRLQAERLRLVERRLALTGNARRRVAALRADGALTPADAEQTEQQWLILALERNDEQLRHGELRARLEQRRLALRRLPLARREQSQRSRLQILERAGALAALEHRRRRPLRAPLTGSVADVRHAEGAWLQQGEVAFTLFRDQPPQLLLLLDDRQRALVRAGDRVRVRFAGHRPERPLRSEGLVRRIESTPSASAGGSGDGATAGPVYRAHTSVPLPPAVQLGHGLRFHGEVEIRRVALWQRLARPALRLVERLRG